MKFQRISNSFLGTADLSVSDVGSCFPDFFAGMAMFITCLDSNKDVSNLTKWMDRLSADGCQPIKVGRAVWIGAGHVRSVFDLGNTFYGFDEVYLLTNGVTPDMVPMSVFTTDACLFADQVPQAFLDGFRGVGASRYLSSGCGLNFVCESATLIDKLADIERRKLRCG